MITPTFLPVGGGDFKISDIKVDGAIGMGEVSMQDMGSDGRFLDTTYYYLNADMMPWIAGTGWYRDIDGFDPVDDSDVMTFGHAMSMTASDVEVSLQYAGEVKGCDPVVTWAAGEGYLGNPTPVRQYFSDIAVEGAIGMGEVNCQKMLPSGRWAEKTYYYLNADMMPWIAGTGWYRDIDGFDPVDEEDFLEPGEGISLTATDVDLTITFKKVLD